MVLWESSQWLGKNILRSTGLKKLQESMDRCIGLRDITEILLKTALNAIQSSNLDRFAFLSYTLEEENIYHQCENGAKCICKKYRLL